MSEADPNFSLGPQRDPLQRIADLEAVVADLRALLVYCAMEHTNHERRIATVEDAVLNVVRVDADAREQADSYLADTQDVLRRLAVRSA